ncbi:MAG: WXG100 family type VII secretion target [Candidatus Dormibacteraeota bacterium]|nr:WXG100 family type VII secretion target [Candidatus Dormibacteraeota bacterium]
MAGSDLLKVGKGELQANAAQVRNYAAEIDQTLARTQQRVLAMLESWLGLGANAFNDLFAEWNSGARQVHDSLLGIATRLERSGTSYDDHDQAIASSIRSQ